MILERISRFFHKQQKHKRNDTLSNNTLEARTADVGHGMFANASNCILNNPIMIDQSLNAMSIQMIYNTIVTGGAVLDRILPHTCPDAAADSRVRSPPPRCLLGTREHILDILNNWLTNCLWKIFWLTGPAGAGKSAIAQTFAEKCAEQGRLGAAYFFIRSSPSHNPRTLIPSLAYQLAVNVPDFQNVLGHAIFQDPSIFHKSLHVQLQKLIVEPFMILQTRKPEIAQDPFFIIIDGLDECEGLETQCEIVETIGEVVRLKKDLPLRWLIASRPELHLQYTFSQPDFSIDYHKEVILIDANTIKDVNLYLRHHFENIRTKSSITAPWPSEVQMRRVEDTASGLFILAATIVRYVSDIEYGDPVRRLTDFFAFISNEKRPTTTNPLQVLDQLYSQILSEIPDDVYQTTKRILALYSRITISHATVAFCYNFLRMDQNVFRGAVKKLHSLFDIPPRDVEGFMRAYHASFLDYLRSQPRSGKFHISLHYLGNNLSKECLFWYKTVLEDPRFVSDDSFAAVLKATTGTPLPGVERDGGWASHLIRLTACGLLWIVLARSRSPFPAVLLGELENFDFRYMFVDHLDLGCFSRFAKSWGPHTTLLHTKPQNQLEQTLLDKAVNDVDRHMEPAVFPIVKINNPGSPYRYIFIGHGTRSCLFWFNENQALSGRCRLSCKVSVRETYTVSDCVIHLPECLKQVSVTKDLNVWSRLPVSSILL